MGKGKDLWDDSALLMAFDDAISKYKSMHALEKGEVTDVHQKVSLPAPEADGGSSEFLSNTKNLQVDNKATSEDRSARTIRSSEPNESPKSQEEYCRLLEKFYDIDYTLRLILPKLYQYTKEEHSWVLEKYYDI